MVIIPYVEVEDKVRKKVGGCHVLFSVTYQSPKDVKF